MIPKRNRTMARTVNLRKQLMLTLVWTALILGAVGVLLSLLTKELLQDVIVLIPVATLGVVCVIWLNQRRFAEATRARLEEASDVYARLSALSDALEMQYREAQSKNPDGPSDPEERRVIH